jgi:hypothetical protein
MGVDVWFAMYGALILVGFARKNDAFVIYGENYCPAKDTQKKSGLSNTRL